MKEKSIYFAVEKIYCILGAIYIIFMLEFSGFKSLESLVSLVRLHRKVSKSRETFKVRDFVNTSPLPQIIAQFHHISSCSHVNTYSKHFEM